MVSTPPPNPLGVTVLIFIGEYTYPYVYMPFPKLYAGLYDHETQFGTQCRANEESKERRLNTRLNEYRSMKCILGAKVFEIN